MTDRAFVHSADYFDEPVDPQTMEVAISNIREGKAFVLGFSGKKASGKDTISDKVAELCRTRDGLEIKTSPFAFPLKQEATSIIASIDLVLRAGNSIAETTERLARVYKMDVEQMADIIHIVLPFVAKGTDVPDGWTRTEEIWALLRYLGTEVRQPQNLHYWVGKTFNQLVSNAADGITTFVNDVRFLHEVEPLIRSGAFVTRVDISPKAQARRLAKRDGVVPDEDALSHRSETELDDYSGFDCRIDNSTDGGLDEKAELVYKSWKNFL